MSTLEPFEIAPKQQRYRSFPKLIAIVLNLCLGSFFFGYSLAYFSTINFNILINIFGINFNPPTAQGLLIGCVPVGALFGSLFSSFLIRYFSRRNCLLLTNLIAFAFGCLLQIPIVYTLFIARIVQGICVGFYSAIVPLIIKELAPIQVAGTLGSYNQLAACFGTFFAFVFEYILAQATGNNGQGIWRYVFGFTLITILFQSIVLLFVFPYQTPKYLLLNHQQQKAKDLLYVIYKDQFVDKILYQKRLDMKSQSSKQPMQQAKKPAYQAKQSTQQAKQSIQYQQSKLPNLNDSVLSSAKQTLQNQQKLQSNNLPGQTKQNNIPKGVGLHLGLLQQFVGIQVVVAYGPPIAQQANPNLNPSIVPMIINAVQVIATLSCGFLLAKVGRKMFLQGGCIGGTVALVLISVGFFVMPPDGVPDTQSTALIFAGLVLFMANFGLSLGPIVWLYIPEIVQPNFIPFTTAINWTGASLTVILFPIIKDALPNQNPAPVFLFFAAWAFISFFVNIKLVVQTKGKTEKQIAQQYAHLL